MRSFAVLFFCALVLPCFGQQRDNRIVIGFTDTVYSKVLNEKRVIQVHVPGGDKNQRYPVLYILDAEDHFQSAVAITEQLSGVLPPMIVIGINNTERERDMTPTHVNPGRIISADEAKASGGGENFMKFIEMELIPYVDSHYPTTPYRVFSGHSLGGLAVVNALFNHTKLFNAYIAIDPSLWWDDEKWINKIESGLSERTFENTGLFVAMANDLPPGVDTVRLLQDTAIIAPVTHAVLPFVRALRATNPKGLRWSTKYYPNEWHGVVELNAIYDGLRYLFKFYRFDMGPIRANPDLNADSLLTAHYQEVSKVLGYKMLPSESNINDLAYTMMGLHKWQNALALFKRNVENYPQSSNAYDSLGEYYEAVGDKQNAIEAYEKSLSLQETADTRRKLNALKK